MMGDLGWPKKALAVAALSGLAFLAYRVAVTRPSDLFQKPGNPAPEFTFRERSGRMFSSGELKGKVWLANFIFARCAGSCPMLSQKFKNFQDAWKGNPELVLVSFTVDPVRDTAENLRKYAEDYKAEDGRWFFLTGTKPDLYKTIREGFKATAMEDSQGKPGFEFLHTSRIYLMDSKGMIRGFYDGEDDVQVEKLKRDLRYLMGRRNKS